MTLARSPKRTAANIFIVASLWVMVATNLSLPSPLFFHALYPPDNSSHTLSKMNWGIRYADWMLQRAGWTAGLKNYWRMFSPADRFNWTMRLSGVTEDGSEFLLPLPHQVQRNFLERNLIDFREEKFYVNIYSNTMAQQAYAQHLCSRFATAEHPLREIRIDLAWQPILAPEEAAARGEFLDPLYVRPWNTFPCLALMQ